MVVVLVFFGVAAGTAAVGPVATVCVPAVVAKLVDEVGMARGPVSGVAAAVVAPFIAVIAFIAVPAFIAFVAVSAVVAFGSVVAFGPVGGVAIAIVPAGALRAATSRFLPWLVPRGTPTAAWVTVVLAVGVVV